MVEWEVSRNLSGGLASSSILQELPVQSRAHALLISIFAQPSQHARVYGQFLRFFLDSTLVMDFSLAFIDAVRDRLLLVFPLSLRITDLTCLFVHHIHT